MEALLTRPPPKLDASPLLFFIPYFFKFTDSCICNLKKIKYLGIAKV